MGGKRALLHRNDANADELYDLARSLGMSIYPISRPIDALGGYLGLSFGIEVKMPKGTLRPGQEAFFREFRGKAYVWRTAEDVLTTHRELHEDARQLALRRVL